jgi:DNA-directed RNA polymerase subunit F
MTILNKTPATLAEVKVIVSKLEERKELKDYFKKFTQLKKDKASELTKQIQDLKNIKIKEVDITKIVDFLPKTQEELNKILTEVSLSEEETNAILAITGKY